MNPNPFPLPQGVVLAPGRGGLPRLVIDTPACSGELYLYGAHVTGWTPRGAAPVLWMSAASAFEPGRPIRGGVPLCFPWFGPHPAAPARPPHGFARLAAWTLAGVERAGDDVRVRLSLAAGGDCDDLWPHRCALSYTVGFGRTLALQLDARNVGAAPCPVEEALHTYFAVGDIRQVSIEGLAGVRYIDKVRGGERAAQDETPLRFDGETDRPYLGTESATTIVDVAWRRRIVVEKAGSRTTVVWNPWLAKAKAMPDFGDDEWQSMVCVETANALDDALTLPAGGAHTMRAIIRLD